MSKGIYKIFRTKEELNAYNLDKCAIWMQMFLDAMTLAIHDEFGFGGERLARLNEAFGRWWQYLNDLFSRDLKEDPELIYSTTKLDRELLAVVGEKNFKPWNERYNMK